MWTSSPVIPLLCKNPIRIACCMLLFWCTPVTGQEHSPNSPATEAVERDALKLLNDSDWAHTVKPSLQDTPCTYQNPAFPGLYPEDKAVAVDATAPTTPPDPVRPDDSEYLIRFQSAKPVQTAIQELLAMGEKWAAYGTRKHQVSEDDRPTDLANWRYNVADMITIAVLLKRDFLSFYATKFDTVELDNAFYRTPRGNCYTCGAPPQTLITDYTCTSRMIT
jgi:hypothetical protein